MYSIMLYMKTRVTFRVSADLADALRELPNQTTFVERALRQALQQPCPVCRGTGHVQTGGLSVSDFRERKLPKLGHDAALQLKGIVAFARNSAATRLDLSAQAAQDGRRALRFRLTRGDTELLQGTLENNATQLTFN